MNTPFSASSTTARLILSRSNRMGVCRADALQRTGFFPLKDVALSAAGKRCRSGLSTDNEGSQRPGAPRFHPAPPGPPEVVSEQLRAAGQGSLPSSRFSSSRCDRLNVSRVPLRRITAYSP